MRTRCLIPILLLVTFIFSAFNIDASEPVPFDNVSGRTMAGNPSIWSNPYGNPSLNSTLPDYNYTGYPSVEWALVLPDVIEGVRSSPVIGPGGDIYFTKGPNLIASSPHGELKWTRSFGEYGDTFSNAIIGPNGTVQVVSSENHLLSYWENGTLRFDLELSYSEFEPQFPISDGNSTYLVTEQRLIKVSAEGEVIWNVTVQEFAPRTPAIFNDTLIVMCEEHVLCYYSSNGTLKWTGDIGEIAQDLPVIDCEGRTWVLTRNADRYGVTIIDSEGGEVLSKTNIANYRWDTQPTITPEGKLAFRTDDTSVYLISDIGVASRRSYDTSGMYYRSPGGLDIISDSMEIYFDSPISYSIRTEFKTHSMAFSEDAIYYVGDSLLKISFNEEKEPSFSRGPIDDISAIEGGDIQINVGYYFDTEDETISNWYFDLETDMEDFTFEVELHNDIHVLMIYPDGGVNGDFRARVKASADWRPNPLVEFMDISRYSNWFDINITPVNSPPEILTDELPPAHQSEFYSVEIEATDPDSDDEHLTYFVVEKGIDPDWLYMRGNYLEGNTPRGANGPHLLDIIVLDIEGNSTRREFELEIIEKAELPIIETDSLTIDEDQKREIRFGDSGYYYYSSRLNIDDPDGFDDHTYTFETGPHIVIEYTQGDDSLSLEPDEDYSGESWFDLTITDDAGTVTKRIEVVVEPRTDPVKDLVIVPLTNLTGLKVGDRLVLDVEFIDPDPEYSREYVYRWDTNRSYYDYLGFDRVLDTDELAPGYHNITVSVDKINAQDTVAYIHIHIQGDMNDIYSQYPDGVLIQEEMDDQENYEKELAKWMIIHFIIFMTFVLGPILCLVFHQLYIKYREKKGVGN